jgi:hypothetical protein
MQSLFQMFGKFPSLMIATFIVIIVTNLVFRTLARTIMWALEEDVSEDERWKEYAYPRTLILAIIIGNIFFLISMFYGPFSFAVYK